MSASVRPLAAPKETWQVVGNRAPELAQRELLRADADPAAGGLVIGLRARERRQLVEREVEPAAADPDADDLDRDAGVADAGDPDVVEPPLQERAEAVGREAKVVLRVLVDPEEHHRADDGHAAV